MAKCDADVLQRRLRRHPVDSAAPPPTELIDAILLADSLHASYISENTAGELPEGADGSASRPDRESLESLARFAEDAARGRKRMWVTHSEVYPGTFASTTETADYLLERLRAKRGPVLRWGPIGMQQLSEVSIGNFYLAGFAGNSAPDHMDHLYALGDWLGRMRMTSGPTGPATHVSKAVSSIVP